MKMAIQLLGLDSSCGDLLYILYVNLTADSVTVANDF